MPKLAFVSTKEWIDPTSFKKLCQENNNLVPEKTVFIFAGNADQHHKAKNGLYGDDTDDLVKSQKDRNQVENRWGGGLAGTANDLSKNGIPTLSLPTSAMSTLEKGKKDPLAEKAIQDIWRAIGAGYNVVLPVRNEGATVQQRKDEKNPTPHLDKLYFTQKSKQLNKQEPKLWGNIDRTPNPELANYYMTELDEIVSFLKSDQKNIPNRFQEYYQQGQNAQKNITSGQLNEVDNFFLTPAQIKQKLIAPQKKQPDLTKIQSNPNIIGKENFSKLSKKQDSHTTEYKTQENLITAWEKKNGPNNVYFYYEEQLNAHFANTYDCRSQTKGKGLLINNDYWPATENYYQYKKLEILLTILKINPGEKLKTCKKSLQDSKPIDAFKKVIERGFFFEGASVNDKVNGLDAGQKEELFKKLDLEMKTALQAKFTQIPEFSKSLLDTGNANLVEVSPTDDNWGIAWKDEKKIQLGDNKLGTFLGEIRTALQLKNTQKKENDQTKTQKDIPIEEPIEKEITVKLNKEIISKELKDIGFKNTPSLAEKNTEIYERPEAKGGGKFELTWPTNNTLHESKFRYSTKEPENAEALTEAIEKINNGRNLKYIIKPEDQKSFDLLIAAKVKPENILSTKLGLDGKEVRWDDQKEQKEEQKQKEKILVKSPPPPFEPLKDSVTLTKTREMEEKGDSSLQNLKNKGSMKF